MKTIIVLAAIFASLHLSAQIGPNTPWTWMKGSKQIGHVGLYGPTGIEGPSYNPAARVSASTFIDGAGNLWLYGGYNYSQAPAISLFMDVWKFNPQTNNWSLQKGNNSINDVPVYGTKGISAPANHPGGRSDAASWTDHEGNFWVFGGYGRDTNGTYGHLNDLWKFNPLTGNWTWIKGTSLADDMGSYGSQGAPSLTNNPSGRYWAVCWSEGEGNLWMYGGENGAIMMADLWRYNIATNTWTWMQGAGNNTTLSPAHGLKNFTAPSNTPGGRAASVGWTDNSGSLYLFGGSVSSWSTQYNDLWKYTPGNNQWTWINGADTPNQPSVQGIQGVAAPTNNPGARRSAATFEDPSGNFWLFGGYGLSTGAGVKGNINDLWKYNTATNEWIWMKNGELDAAGIYGLQGVPANGNKPGSRSQHMTWTDASGNFWLFGGYGAGEDPTMSAELNDLWRLSGNPVLPVSLISFTGQNKGTEILLAWTVEGIEDVNEFVLEKSIDGIKFNSIGVVKPYQNSRQYIFADTKPGTGPLYYRLKITGLNGSITYSTVVYFNNHHNQLTVYPNPATAVLHLSLRGTDAGGSIYRISDVSGRTVLSGPVIDVSPGFLKIEVCNLRPGVYMLTIESKTGIKSASFIKM